MRKSKLLIPALSIASVGAIVAPMVTSCTKANPNVTDLINYNPKYAQMPGWVTLAETTNNEHQASLALFGSSNALEIVKQDMNYYLCYNVKVVKYLQKILEPFLPTLTGLGRVLAAESEITNLEIDYDFDTGVAKLSGNIRLKVVMETLDDDLEVDGTYVLETKHEIEKLPYQLAYKFVDPTKKTDTDPACWKTWFNWNTTTGLPANKKWSVKRTYHSQDLDKSGKVVEDYDTDEVTYNATEYNKKSPAEQAAIQEAVGFLAFWSYYLENTKSADKAS